MTPLPPLASLDGSIGPAAEASIPVTDDGLLRGDGGFEVLRLYGGRPFALEEHLGRLAATLAGIKLEADLGALEREATALIARADGADGLLRIVVTRGGRRIMLLEPLPSTPAEQTVHSVTYAPTGLLSGLKTLSYAANMLAKRIAVEQGADEALFVTPQGRVLEGPTWSLFWVAGGELVTPPLAEGILASITRAHVVELTGASERATTLEDLRGAEEAFIASTVREVMPIKRLDDVVLAGAAGPVTAAAAAQLGDYIRRSPR